MIEPYPVWEIHLKNKAEGMIPFQVLSLYLSGINGAYGAEDLQLPMWIIFGVVFGGFVLTVRSWWSARKIVEEWKSVVDAIQERRSPR